MAAPRYITSTSGVLTEVAAAETGPASTPAEQIVSTNSAGLVDATLLPASATIPAGGTTGQALTKNSGTDYDTGWTGPYVLRPGDTMTGQLNNNYSGLQYTNTEAATSGVFVAAITPQRAALGYAPAAYPAGTTYGFGLGSIAPADPGGATAYNGAVFAATINGGNNFSTLIGTSYFAIHAGSGAVGTGGATALKASARVTAGGTAPQSPPSQGVSALTAQIQSTNSSHITTACALQVFSPATTGSGLIDDIYGLYVTAQTVTGVTRGWAIAAPGATDNSYLAGALSVGKTGAPTTSALLDLSSTTGALLIPRMTTTQRTALTGTNGMLVYDSTVNGFFKYTNSKWVQWSFLHSPYSKQVPTTGFSITIADGVNYLILDPAGTLATGTVTMDASPIDGQEVTISSSQVITALTVSANTGQSIIGAATTFAANGFAKYKYVVANTTWYRVG